MKKVDTLLMHALILTVDKENRIIKDGALAINGNDIVAIDETQILESQYVADAAIDASGKMLMPGLINTHSHLATVLLRGLAEDLALEPWLQKVWFAENAIVNRANVEAGAQLAMTELLLGGTTCAVDMYWFPQGSASAAQRTGFRLVNGPVFLEMSEAPDGMSMTDRIGFSHEYMQAYQDDPLIHPMIMPHATYTDSPDTLRLTEKLAEQYGVGVHIHTSETATEVENVVRQYGKTPIELLQSLEMLHEGILLAHCVHVGENEIEMIAHSGASVSHNPASNLKLGSGVAPITRMQAAGVKLALGTDGAQSGNDLNMWLAARLAALMQKGVLQDATVMPAKDMVRMLTIDAAQAIGLDDRIGSLEVGKNADVIMIDLDAPHLVPLHDVYAHLIYAIGREDIDSVWVNGRLVVQAHEMQTVDEHEAKAAVRAVAASI